MLGPPGKALFVFAACGVMIIGSSVSSGSRGSISSDELLESSEPSMLMLPTELDGPVLPPLLQPPWELTLGDSIIIELARGLLEGILIPFCVIVGEESGDDWSGSVEWCRLVQARENSAPRERRGSSEAGEAYVLWESSCGDNGTRAAKCAGLGMGSSRGGICSERPLERKSGRRGVLGLAITVWSSFDVLVGSRNLGEGSSLGVLSERERALDFCGVCIGCGSRTAPSSRRRLSVNMMSVIDMKRVVVGCQHITRRLQIDSKFRILVFHGEPWALREGWVVEAGRVLNLTWQARLCHKHSPCERPQDRQLGCALGIFHWIA
jgi:hypothetical protein